LALKSIFIKVGATWTPSAISSQQISRWARANSTMPATRYGPRFDADGKLTRPAHVTVLHNGVLVQDNVELTGPTGHHVRPPYKPSPEKLPLALQDHNHPVRYRNIWIRNL
jgi:hypothetical protein